MVLQGDDCLVVDEVSTVTKGQFVRLGRLLRKAKRIHGVPFGGIHMILVRDFLQLPPVGADPIFADPAEKHKVSLEGFKGFHLWRQFDKVVVLRECVRFKDDPEWGEGCSQARYGVWTPAFIAMINSRLVGGNTSCAEQAQLQLGVVFVTPDNDTRTAINAHIMAMAGQQLPAPEFPIRVIANFRGALNKFIAADVDHIMGLTDTKFLDLIPGMPIQITQNVRTKKRVANGSMGTLHSVIFPEATSSYLSCC